MTPFRSAKRLARTVLKRLQGGGRGRGSGPRVSEFADAVDRRREWMDVHLPPESAEYLYDIHAKDKQKALARQLGLAVAEEYLTRVPFAEALAYVETCEHDALVLKPMHGRSGAGVFTLVREGTRFRDLKNGKLLSLADIKREGDESYGSLGRRDEWQVEELLLPPDGSHEHIEDYKFFCFAGRVALILQKGVVGKGRRRKGVIRWYDPDWQPVVTGVWPWAVSDALEPPAAADALVSEAERATRQIPLPFMRIDLYDSHRGVVLGEFTPGPGGLRQFNDEWQARFIRLYREAAAELEAGLRTGAIAPLMPPGSTRPQPVAARK